jgi:LysM repeat protein
MKWLFLLVAALLLSACNLNSRAVEQQSLSTIVAQTVITPTVATLEGRDEAATPFPTEEANDEAQSVEASNGVEAPAGSIGSSGGVVTGSGGVTGGGGWRPVCTPRYDWYLYVVRPGDTLNRIAARAGTTANVLAAANCLANPNLIAVGQQLRVPYYLPPVTQPPPITPPPNVYYVGAVDVSPIVRADSEGLLLTPGTYVTLRWGVNLPNVTRVEFYIVPPGSGYPNLIGTDTYIWDGIAATWLVPSIRGNVYAVGYNGNTIVARTARDTAIYTAPPDPGNITSTRISITPSYLAPDGITRLNVGATITVRWEASFPSSVSYVEFTIEETSSESPTRDFLRAVSTDNTLYDGATMTWTVPRPFTGTVRALAYFANGTVQGSDIVNVIAG